MEFIKKCVYVLWPVFVHMIVLEGLTVLYGIFFSGWRMAWEFYYKHILLISCISGLFSIPVLLYLVYQDKKKRGTCRRKQGLGWPKSWLYAILLGISVCVAGNGLIILSGISKLFSSYEEVSRDLYSPSIVIQAAAVGIVLPLVEELTFRGLVFSRLKEFFSFQKAAVISALCFALYHGNMVQGIYAFCIGYLLAYCYGHYGSLAIPFIIHISANLFSILLTNTELDSLFYANQAAVWISTVLFLILIGISIKKAAGI